jgi:hypothetical protein
LRELHKINGKRNQRNSTYDLCDSTRPFNSREPCSDRPGE